MWRLLLQAGLGFATFDIGRRIARLKRSAVYFGVAGVVGLLGLGSLTAAAVIALIPHLGAAGAAAAVGGGLVLVAALVGWIGSWERPPAKAPAPVFDRVRAEVGAVGSAVSQARAKRAANRVADEVSEEVVAATPGSRRKRAINMVLIATLAGVVLGRRL